MVDIIVSTGNVVDFGLVQHNRSGQQQGENYGPYSVTPGSEYQVEFLPPSNEEIDAVAAHFSGTGYIDGNKSGCA
ncbi:MAG: hypothetical protein ACRDY2_06730 [Acidimicrobiales bacterium]